MIQNTIRFSVNDGPNLVAYVSAPGENESVDWIMGCEENLHVAIAKADMADARYSLRHQMISPERHLSKQELAQIVADYCDEFDVPQESRELICIVQHTKKRADDGDENDLHYHVVIPEIDDEGAELDSRFSKVRNEKLSRIAELQFQHPSVPGRHNKSVIEHLKRERPDLDLQPLHDAIAAVAEADGQDPDTWRPQSAYGDKSHQRMQRQLRQSNDRRGPGEPTLYKEIIPSVRAELKKMGQGADIHTFLDRVEERGFEITAGRKAGVWMISRNGHELGALHRMSPFRKRELDDAISERGIQNDPTHDLSRSRRAGRSVDRPQEPAHRPRADRDTQDEGRRRVSESGARAADGPGRQPGAGPDDRSPRADREGTCDSQKAANSDLQGSHGSQQRPESQPSKQVAQRIQGRFRAASQRSTAARLGGGGGGVAVPEPIADDAMSALNAWARNRRAAMSAERSGPGPG